MIDIERSTRKSKTIPLVSLIDVVFQLLIYFMLSTSFTRSESLELLLPSAKPSPVALQKREDAQTVHIYISNNGETFLEKQSMGEQDMMHELRAMLAINPNRGVLLLSANQVQVGLMVRVLDRIYTAGGKNIALADWVIPTADIKPVGKTHG